jgi:hypothetical protein
MNEKVVVEVPIKTKGPSKGEAEGGILVVQLDKVRVRCLPLEIPDQIDVDIRALLQHDSIHVKDLVLPKGIEAVDAPEALVLSIVEPKKEELPVPGTAEVAPTEPELIVKPPKPGEEEEGAAAPEAGADKKGGAAPAKKEKDKSNRKPRCAALQLSGLAARSWMRRACKQTTIGGRARVRVRRLLRSADRVLPTDEGAGRAREPGGSTRGRATTSASGGAQGRVALR